MRALASRAPSYPLFSSEAQSGAMFTVVRARAKSSHDAIAVLSILVSLFVGAYFLRRFRARLTEEERAALVARGEDRVAIAAVAGVGIAYVFSPVHPVSAILGAAACTALSACRLRHYHSQQTYSFASRTMLILGLTIPGVGFLAAVVLRAMR
jgi:hypothetical protein